MGKSEQRKAQQEAERLKEERALSRRGIIYTLMFMALGVLGIMGLLIDRISLFAGSRRSALIIGTSAAATIGAFLLGSVGYRSLLKHIEKRTGSRREAMSRTDAIEIGAFSIMLLAVLILSSMN
ncbi:MAG TPA: hypothetical protein DCZ71_03600 [Ruminococcus sp.]|nr:hypothetical protein [Ruminococcus sp.]